MDLKASGDAQSSAKSHVDKEEQLESAKSPAVKRSKQKKCGDNATMLPSLNELIDSGYVKPGPKVLKMTYRGQTYFADLFVGGTMFEHGKTSRYWYPSKFTLAMKRKVNRRLVKDSKAWTTLLYCHDGVEMPLANIWNQYLQDGNGVIDSRYKQNKEEKDEDKE